MTTTYTPDEVLLASQGIRQRCVDLLRAATDEQANAPVPTCPGWSATELSCHLYGVADDILNGRLDGIGSDAWTQAQVDLHSAKALQQIADEWEASAEAFDPIVLVLPDPTNSQLVWDMVTHEHDLRLAIGEPGAQDDLAVSVGAAYQLRSLRDQDPELTDIVEGLGLSDFELLRALSGRRSAPQLEALGIPSERLALVLEPSPISIVEVDVDESVA